MMKFAKIFSDYEKVATKSQKLLDLDNGNIRICQYLTKLPPKELLKKKMHEAILNVKKRLDNE